MLALDIIAKSPGLAGKSRFGMASPADLGHFSLNSQAACLIVCTGNELATVAKECDTCHFLHNHVSITLLMPAQL